VDTQLVGRGHAEVVRQVGYSIGDVIAKPVFGLIIFAIALSKSRDDGYEPALEEDPIQVPDDVSELVDR